MVPHVCSHYWGDTLSEGTFAVGGAEPVVYICAFSPPEGYPPLFKDWHMCGCCYMFNTENATSFAGYCSDSKGVCQTLCDVTTVRKALRSGVFSRCRVCPNQRIIRVDFWCC